MNDTDGLNLLRVHRRQTLPPVCAGCGSRARHTQDIVLNEATDYESGSQGFKVMRILLGHRALADGTDPTKRACPRKGEIWALAVDVAENRKYFVSKSVILVHEHAVQSPSRWTRRSVRIPT